MPVCFQLYPLGESEPAPLAAIDDALRAHFNEPPSATDYLCGWVDSIGFRLAMGESWAEVRADLAEYPGLTAITDYLAARYTTRAWREQKR